MWPAMLSGLISKRSTATASSDGSSHGRVRGGMSLSSAESWHRWGTDIIDLDRYMRGGTGRPQQLAQRDRKRLVVDRGGSKAPPQVAAPVYNTSSSITSVPRDKRYSHDSGLSDGSYVKRRPHRRVAAEGPKREREPRTPNSANSLRTFRIVFERALRDQQDKFQEQITRVTQLCERLSRAQAPPSSSLDSSDFSSSSRPSRSTRDCRRKDKHRMDECKTYKLIMTKLEELNRVLNSRAKSPPSPSPAPAAPRALSAGSVSVSDKQVATEPLPGTNCDRVVGYVLTAGCQVAGAGSTALTHSSGDKTTLNKQQTVVVSRAGRVARRGARDSPPSEEKPALRRTGCLNVANDSVVECESECSGSSAHAPHCRFDLDDPLHLYTQAKRLQDLHALRAATARRAHSAETRRAPPPAAKRTSHSHSSLCGRCIGYWRTLTALASQLFNRDPAL